MLQSQRGKLRQQLWRRIPQVDQVLVALRKRVPVIAGKRDPGFGGRWGSVVVERDVGRRRTPGKGARRGGQAGNELLFARRRFQEQHRVVRRRALEIDLGETGELAAPQRRIYRTEKIEK